MWSIDSAIVVLFIVLVLFGAKRIPDLMRAVGRSLWDLQLKDVEKGMRIEEMLYPRRPMSRRDIRVNDAIALCFLLVGIGIIVIGLLTASARGH